MISPIKKNNGISLIELMVVLVVVGIVLSLVGPRFTGSFGITSLKTASARLASLINYGRYYAIKEGIKCRLYYDLEQGSYWMTAQEEGAGQEVQDVRLNNSWGRAQRLPEGVSFRAIDDSAQVTEGDENLRQTTFYPDGRIDKCQIFLEDRDGDIFTVLTFRNTGRVKVLDYEFTGFEE